ncbi:PBP1A family penicillin-binding protein [Desulfococcaceae bacterium OttesenSCG-928-F15]|nr:PBP1A family penicillin-binding protein [Desulfococcaceae bacterium OttesenSCG-928-F15]
MNDQPVKKKWKKTRIFLKLMKWCFILLFFISILGLIAVSFAYKWYSQGLPSIANLKTYKPPTVSTVYAVDGTVVAEFFNERRIVIPLSEMPDHLIKAFVAAEDSRFFQHKGVDPISIARASWKNFQANSIVQGGSTITQQVAKSFFLSPERKYVRKIKEAILAYNIERNLSKEEILYLYLNQIFLGHGAYGVEAAAQNYFNVSAKDLTLAQSAMIAGLPQAPSKYTPFRFPAKAKERQMYVLGRMVAEGFISREEERKIAAETLKTFPRANIYREVAPYYTEHVRQYVLDRYGERTLYEEGLKIYTALDLAKLRVAESALQTGLRDLDKRQGYRGPIANIALTEVEAAIAGIGEKFEGKDLVPGFQTQGIVTHMDAKAKKTRVRFGKEVGEIPLDTMRWAKDATAETPKRVEKPENVFQIGDQILIRLVEKKKDGVWDLRLEQIPRVEGSILCMEIATGKVLAMMGGRDFAHSQFNRATQAQRQAGSVFKPFVYAAALDKGFTPASIVVDNAIVFKDTKRDFTWKPKNYQEVFYGPTILREALAKSRNLITITLLDTIGLDYALEYINKLGLTPPVYRDLSLALGSSGHSLLEIVRAYGVFANEGKLTDPVFITEIRDRNDELLEKSILSQKEAISPETAFLMTSLMESVITSGTARVIMPLVEKGWSVAGKTGTTNNLHDAWFVGYTPNYVTGVWVGFDSEETLGRAETGGRAAAPIWLDFMQTILKDETPLRFPPPPSGIVAVTIDAKTGLLPIPESLSTRTEYFKTGTEPKQYTRRVGEISTEKDFFKEGL